MNKELFMVFIPGLSWILFALGGTQISDKVPGWKGWRRFILPLIYAAATIYAGFAFWQATLVSAIACLVYSLPYGERTKWPVKLLVAVGYGWISVPVGISAWNFVTVGLFILLFVLSNTKATASTVTWKIVEGFVGAAVGVQLAYQLMRRVP